jgi:poly(3-hydroxyalkanoate) depolymerase
MSPFLPTELVDVGGRRLRVSIAGRGRPLLLLNGIGAALELLEPLRRGLHDVETIAIDLPGSGGSGATFLPVRLAGLARVVRRALDALGYREVDVLGVSWGGALAQELAYRHGDRVRRLVLAATMPGWLGVPGRPSALWVLATPRRYYSRAYFERVAPTLYGGAARDAPHLLRSQEHLRFLRPPSVRGYLWQLFATWGWTSVPWLHRVDRPTLVLAADDDPIVPLANARMLRRLLPDARLHVVERGGHLFLVTHVAEVAPVIDAFLKADLGPDYPQIKPFTQSNEQH